MVVQTDMQYFLRRERLISPCLKAEALRRVLVIFDFGLLDKNARNSWINKQHVFTPKKIFRQANRTYHEGKRARALIDSLDMQKIMDTSSAPLTMIESVIF